MLLRSRVFEMSCINSSWEYRENIIINIIYINGNFRIRNRITKFVHILILLRKCYWEVEYSKYRVLIRRGNIGKILLRDRLIDEYLYLFFFISLRNGNFSIRNRVTKFVRILILLRKCYWEVEYSKCRVLIRQRIIGKILL